MTPAARDRLLLLAEDDPDHAELVRRCLAGEPVRVVHLADGAAALAYLTHAPPYADPADAPAPDVVLLDLRLPRVDGLDVLRAVKADPATRPIPVVVLSSSAAPKDVAGAYAAHANSYLVKSADADEFDRLVRDVGRYWLGRNQRPGG